MVLSLPLPQPLPLRSFRLLAATRFAGDEVGGTSEDIFLRGLVCRGGGEELEGLEVIRLHHGMMGGGSAAAGEEQDREDQDQLGDEGRQVADDTLGAADVTRRRIMDELLTAVNQDERQKDREGEEHPAHQAIALGGTMKDFGSGGRSGAGHGESESEWPTSAGNPALGRVGTASRHSTPPSS